MMRSRPVRSWKACSVVHALACGADSSAATCFLSLLGSHQSSSSRNAMYAADPASAPRFLAAAPPMRPEVTISRAPRPSVSALRRAPDVEAPELVAVDATDRL